MPTPSGLLRVISGAWEGEPPLLPQEWESADLLESHDVFTVFGSKRWDEVVCTGLPRAFNPLTWMQPQSQAAALYYLATYLSCYFCAPADDSDHIIDSIEFFLAGIVETGSDHQVSIERFRAINEFLQLTSEKIEWIYLPQLPQIWKELMESRRLYP